MNLSNQDIQLGPGMFTSTATQGPPLGSRGYDKMGRAYRYVKAGAVDLIAGNAIQSPATVAGHLTLTLCTTAITAASTTNVSISPLSTGSTFLTFTCASAVASNYYVDGFLGIATGAGQGLAYAVYNHPAVSTGASGQFNLYPEDALQVAITATSKVSLMANKYSGVVQAPVTTLTGVIIGYAPYVISANQYGWIQTWGPCLIKGADTTALGGLVISPATACGEASGITAASLLTGQLIGHMMQISVAQQYVWCDLRISP